MVQHPSTRRIVCLWTATALTICLSFAAGAENPNGQSSTKASSATIVTAPENAPTSQTPQTDARQNSDPASHLPLIKLDGLQEGPQAVPGAHQAKIELNTSETRSFMDWVVYAVCGFLLMMALPFAFIGWKNDSKPTFFIGLGCSIVCLIAIIAVKTTSVLESMRQGGKKPDHTAARKSEPTDVWAIMDSDAFAFNITMPQPVTLKRKVVDGVLLTELSHTDANGTMTVESGRPALLNTKEPQKVAKGKDEQSHKEWKFDPDSIVQRFVDDLHGKVTSQIERDIDRVCTIRDVAGQAPGQHGQQAIFHMYVYLTPKTEFYQATVAGNDDYVISADALLFLQSLHLKAEDEVARLDGKVGGEQLSEDATKPQSTATATAAGPATAPATANAKGPSEEAWKSFYTASAQAVQENLKLRNCKPFYPDGDPYKIVVSVDIDGHGKINKMEVKSRIQNENKEKLANALTKAVNGATFTAPENAANGLTFTVKLVGDKVECESGETN